VETINSSPGRSGSFAIKQQISSLQYAVRL